MHVRIDQSRDEGFASCVDRVDQWSCGVKDARNATVIDNDCPAALNRTAAPISQGHGAEHQRFIDWSLYDPVEGVGVSSHEPASHRQYAMAAALPAATSVTATPATVSISTRRILFPNTPSPFPNTPRRLLRETMSQSSCCGSANRTLSNAGRSPTRNAFRGVQRMYRPRCVEPAARRNRTRPTALEPGRCHTVPAEYSQRRRKKCVPSTTGSGSNHAASAGDSTVSAPNPRKWLRRSGGRDAGAGSSRAARQSKGRWYVRCPWT